jgi:tetratricopeptide (TPR) repeat protein
MSADSNGQANRILAATATILAAISALVSIILALAEAPTWQLWLLPIALAIIGLLLVAYLAWRRFHGRENIIILLTVVVIVTLVLVAAFSANRLAMERRAAAAAQGCHEASNRVDKGRDYLKQGEQERAIDEFRVAAALCAEDGLVANASMNRGMAYFDRGNEREAIRYLTESLNRRENHQAFLTRGKAYGSELADCDAAAFDFRNSLRIKKDFDPAYHNLASIRARQGSYKRALDAITRALELNESEANYLLMRAMVHLASRETNKAINDLQASIDLSRGKNNTYNRDVYSRATRLLHQVEIRSIPVPTVLFAPCRSDFQ